jgi:hypothetical protein
MQRALITDPVVFISPSGERFAAIVARDPADVTSPERDLVVFWYNGEAAFPMRGVARQMTPGECSTWNYPPIGSIAAG